MWANGYSHLPTTIARRNVVFAHQAGLRAWEPFHLAFPATASGALRRLLPYRCGGSAGFSPVFPIIPKGT